MITFSKEEIAFIEKEFKLKFEQSKEYDYYTIGPDVYEKMHDMCADIIEYEALNRTEDEPTEREFAAEKLQDKLYFDRITSMSN